jgi:arylsulfatase A-like enzyme
VTLEPALTRRRFLELIAGSSLGLACEELRRGGGRRGPNLIVLVTDDQRADSLGSMGNPVVSSPALDALAADGAVFDAAFVTTAVCPTSRASILTGLYGRRHGVLDFSTPLPPELLAASYPLVLWGAGYRTGFLGKWGLGGELPRELFDVFWGFSGSGRYFVEDQGERRHLTAVLARRAVAFLEEQPRERPFCLSVSFKAPHGPGEYDPAFAALYRDQPIELPASATPESQRALPEFLRRSMSGREGLRWVERPDALRDRVRGYYRLLAGVDAAVEQLRAALERLGLAEDTVLVFTSDNGMLFGEHGLMGKWLMYEESIRVPLLVRDPRLPAERRRRRVREMALNVDLAPTLLELAGLPALPGLHGRSLVPLLRGEARDWREAWLYEHPEHESRLGYLPALEGVRTPEWKYVRYLAPASDAASLFDLRRDPREERDLAASPEHRAILDELERLRLELRARLG